VRQKDCPAFGKAPDDNVQSGPRYQGVFGGDRLDRANRCFGPVRGENRNSRKIRAEDSGRRVRNENRIRESVWGWRLELLKLAFPYRPRDMRRAMHARA
jgi:hypothetical protein